MHILSSSRGDGLCSWTESHRVGTQLTVDQLRKSLLDPDPTVPGDLSTLRVITRDGKAISGRLLNQDPYSLQMIDSDSQLVAFERSELREWGFHANSAMPSYRETLNTDRAGRLAGLSRVPQRRGSPMRGPVSFWKANSSFR